MDILEVGGGEKVEQEYGGDASALREARSGTNFWWKWCRCGDSASYAS